MKKHWKAAAAAISGAAIMIGAVGFFALNQKVVDVQPSSVVTDLESTLNANDRVLLEVVPDASYAQLGYLEPGNEPINILKAAKDGKAADIQKVAGSGVEVKDIIDDVTYDKLVSVYNNFDTCWEPVTGASVKYRFKYTGGFPVVTETLSKTLSAQLNSSGEDKVVVKTITTDQLNAADSSDIANLMKKVDYVYISQTYVKGAEDEQKDLAKNYSPNKDTITTDVTFLDKDINWSALKPIYASAAKVAKSSNADTTKNTILVMDSSIYYGALDASSAVKVDTYQYELNRSVKYKYTEEDWKVSDGAKEKNLFGKTDAIAGKNKKASSNNMYKLYLMSMFRDPGEFYNLFVESGLISGDDGPATYQLQTSGTLEYEIATSSTSGESGSGDASKAWNTYSFLPCKKEIEYKDHEEGNKDFWEKEMGITLSYDDGSSVKKKVVNANMVSWDATKGSFVDSFKAESLKGFYVVSAGSNKDITLLEALDTAYAYEPKTYIEGRKYKVLELEPANHFSLQEAHIEKLLPYTGYSTSSTLELKITKMTTAEFVGKTESLVSNYDLIYIGNDIEGLHTKKDEDGVLKTYYGGTTSDGDTFNKDMAGVIYAHVGGSVVFNYGTSTLKSYSEAGNDKDPSNGAALFDKGDNRRLQFSGNDITRKKASELVDYLNSGLPIVVAEGLVNDAQSSKPTYFNDLSYNNMYKFLSTSSNAEKLLSLDFNYHNISSVEADEKLKRLTKRKPEFKVTKLSAAGSTEGFYSEDTGEIYKNMVFTFDPGSDVRRFTFTYKATNPENRGQTFIAELYVDKNADGVYKSGERVGRTSFTGNGNAYTYSFNMNTNYRGAFTWKFVAYPEGRPYEVCSQTGYGTIRFDGEVNARAVKVLQVMATTGKAYATDWGPTYARTIDLTQDPYKTLLASDAVAKDYAVTVEKKSLDDFEAMASDDLIETYDMIIFGFADSYRDEEFTTNSANNIQKFKDAGKSIMFSHDLTSQINNSDYAGKTTPAYQGTFMETTNGAGFNKYIRDIMGLNRFGDATKTANGTLGDPTGYYDNTSIGDKYAFTYTVLMQYSNFRRAWVSGETITDSEYPGPYKNLFLNLGTKNTGWPEISLGYETQYVTNVNDGQITKYPFDLDAECASDKTEHGYKIAPTHGQYYQLNLEAEDVVCWYALSDDKSGNGWYSASPNDAANNYYIYNKGNITYSGIGHRGGTAVTTFEQKLFINTIIAALRAGVEGPQPHITNGYNVPETDEDRYVVYADVDADSDDEDFNSSQNVEFYVTDDSSSNSVGDTLYVALEVATDEKDENGKVIYKELTSDRSFKLKDKSTGNEIEPITIKREVQKKTEGGTLTTVQEEHVVWEVKRTKDELTVPVQYDYILKYPKSVLKDKSYQNFKLVAYNKKHAKGYQFGAVMRKALFPLD